jgi:hypothetical protein
MGAEGAKPSFPASRWVPAAVVGGVLAVAFIAPVHNELRTAALPQDEGLLFAYPALILHGAVPNHTFESVYGASNLWIIAAAFKIAGYGVSVERAVGIAYRLVVVASLATLAWRHRGPVAALASGAVCIVLIEGRVGLAAYSWFGALAFAALAFLLLDVGLARGLRRLPVVAAGFCFGMAVSARLDMAFAVLLVIVALLVVWRLCVPWLLVGMVVGLMALVANVVQAGPAAVLRDQVIEPIFVSGPGRRLALTKLTWQELTLLFLCVAVAVASVVVGIVRVRRDGRRRDAPRAWEPMFLLTIGVFEVGILPQAFQRSDQLHLALVACFVLPAAVLLPAWPRRAGPEGTGFNWTPVVVGVVVLVMAEPYFGQSYWSAVGPAGKAHALHVVSNQGRSVPVDSEKDQRHLTGLLKALDARAHPGQRVFVGPDDLRTANYDDTFIYYLLPQLTPGSYYLEMDPGVANGSSSQLARDLDQDQFLILDNRYDKFPDLDRSTRFGPREPNAIVKSQFVKVLAKGPWVLYQQRS